MELCHLELVVKKVAALYSHHYTIELINDYLFFYLIRLVANSSCIIGGCLQNCTQKHTILV